MNLSEKDYKPVQQFREWWRWDPKRGVAITPEELARIRPLSAPAEKAAWDESLKFVGNNNDFRPNDDLFKSIVELNVLNEDVEIVRYWLAANIVTATEPLIVSWQPDLAVITDCEVFCKFWDDFCLAGKDDTSVWPISGGWLLHYWHEEVLYLAK